MLAKSQRTMENRTKSDVDNVMKACDAAKKCVSSATCLEYQLWSEQINDLCEHQDMLIAGVPECYEAFYGLSYFGEYNCTGSFHFASFNLTEKRSAFTSGKSCFLEVIQKECENKTVKYIREHYNEILDVFTVEPKNETEGSCFTLFHKFSTMQCLPFQTHLASFVSGKDLDDPEVKEGALKICDKSLYCSHQLCDLQFLEGNQRTCGLIKTAGSKLIPCAKEMFDNTKLVGNYSCFKELSTDAERCLKPNEMRECIMSMLQENCKEIQVEKEELFWYSDIMSLAYFECIETMK